MPETEPKRKSGDTGLEIGQCGGQRISQDVSLPNTLPHSKRCGGKTLVDTLAETLTKVRAITLADKVSDVESDSLDYTRPDTLTDVKAQTVGQILSDV